MPRKSNKRINTTNLTDEQKQIYKDLIDKQKANLDTSEVTSKSSEPQTKKVRKQIQQPQVQTQSKIPLSDDKIDLNEKEKELYSTMVAEKLGMSNSRGVFKNYFIGSDGSLTSTAKKPTANPQSESRKSSKRKT